MTLPQRAAPDHSLPQLTTEAVGQALSGFPLPIVNGKDLSWLADSIKLELEYSVEPKHYSPQKMSNADIRQRMRKMSESIEATLKILREREYDVDLQLKAMASAYALGDGPTYFGLFLQSIDSLSQSHEFLQLAQEEIRKQRGPWRQSIEKLTRIERALILAPVFEAAFGELVTANNFPNDARHKAPTSFMDFFSRIMTLAFGARETSNLAEVVKQACQWHRQNPEARAEGISSVA